MIGDMDELYDVENTFVKNSTVVIVIRLVETDEEFYLNIPQGMFDKMDERELEYRIEKAVRQKLGGNTSRDNVMSKVDNVNARKAARKEAREQAALVNARKSNVSVVK